MTSYTLTMPLPPKELHPNARPHFMAKAKATKRYRVLAACEATLRSMNDKPRWNTATVQATFYVKDRRPRDRDNLLASLKAAFDGIADAGIVANDSGLTHMPVVVAVDRIRPRVELTIYGPTIMMSELAKLMGMASSANAT